MDHGSLFVKSGGASQPSNMASLDAVAYEELCLCLPLRCLGRNRHLQGNIRRRNIRKNPNAEAKTSIVAAGTRCSCSLMRKMQKK